MDFFLLDYLAIISLISEAVRVVIVVHVVRFVDLYTAFCPTIEDFGLLLDTVIDDVLKEDIWVLGRDNVF